MSFFDKLFRKQRKTPTAAIDRVTPDVANVGTAEPSKAVPDSEQPAAPIDQSIAPTSFIRPFDLSRHTLTPSEPFLKPAPILPLQDLSGPSLISFELDDSARRDREFQCFHRYKRVKSLTSEYDLCTNCGHRVLHWSARI